MAGMGLMGTSRLAAAAPTYNMTNNPAPIMGPPSPGLMRSNPYAMANATANTRGGNTGGVYQAKMQEYMTPDQGGVVAGRPPTMNAVQQAQMNGPTAAEIQAEMQRRQVGSEIGKDPRNAAIAGYMMGK